MKDVTARVGVKEYGERWGAVEHRRPLRRVARIHRRGALSSATRRGGVHPAGAFCCSTMAHAPPPLSHAGFRIPPGTWKLEPGRNMYASQHPACHHLRRGTGTLEPWNLHNLTAPPWNLEHRKPAHVLLSPRGSDSLLTKTCYIVKDLV